MKKTKMTNDGFYQYLLDNEEELWLLTGSPPICLLRSGIIKIYKQYVESKKGEIKED